MCLGHRRDAGRPRHRRAHWYPHRGDEVRGDDVAGMAVHIGARASVLAGCGEVLVSSTVRDLVVGSSVEFVERGEHELKGVPGAWRLFVVDG